MISKTIDLAGDLVHFVDFGGTGRPIVLVHGLGGSHVNWLAVAAELTTHGHVVAIDLPGFGLSERSSRGTSIEVMGGALSSFMDAMSDEPVHLIGNSMGGALSILESSKRPNRVKSALLVCPALPMPRGASKVDPAWMITLAIACAPYGHVLLKRRAAKIGARQMIHEMMRICCVDASRVPASVLEAHLEIASSRASRPWADLAFGEATRSVVSHLFIGRNFRKAMKDLKPPTLIVQGQCDRLVDVRAARAAVALAPQIELRELPDIGHTPQLEAPVAFVEIAKGWFDRHAN